MSERDLTLDQTWKEEAQEFQQNMFLRLGDREWDEWNIPEKTILESKVRFGLYTLTEHFPRANNLEYKQDQLKNIEHVTEVILKNANSSETIQFACISILGKISEKLFHIPVFKVKGKENQILFVDSYGCVYGNWQDYLDSNRLPEGMYCYPKGGLYQGDNDGQVLVDFRISSGCDSDSTATVVNFAPTTVMEAFSSTVPITDPIPAAVQGTSEETGDTTRSVTNLVDHQWRDHLLGDLKEIMNMLGIFSIVLNKAQSDLRANITRSAATGKLASLALCITYNAVSVSRLTVNGLGILCDLIKLVDKVDEDPLTDNDVFQFLGSVLFFSNSLLKSKTAEDIIQETQNKVLDTYCDDLTPLQFYEYCKLSHQVKGKSQLHKNAIKIKAINHIGDKEAFFGSLVTAKNDLKGHQVQFSVEPGLVNINDELHIAPNKLVQMSKEDYDMIIQACEWIKKLNDSKDPSHKKYKKRLESILIKNRLNMEFQRRENIAKLNEAFKTENLAMVKIGNEYIFKNIKPFELDRLARVMEATVKNYNPDILNIVNEFANMRDCKNVFDYCSFAEFTVKHLEDLHGIKEEHFQASLKAHKDEKMKNNEKFDENEFYIKMGIVGNRKKHFYKDIFNNFGEESFKNLNDLYTNQENIVRPVNANSTPNFASVPAAVYHYFKHSDFGGEKLTSQQYFAIAEELVHEPLKRASKQLNQQGNKTNIIFENPINGAKLVVYETLVDGKLSLATLYYDEKVLNKTK